MLIVDSTLAIVGSFNLTASGTTDNQELAVIIRNKDIVPKLKRLAYKLDTAAVRIDRNRQAPAQKPEEPAIAAQYQKQTTTKV